MLFELLLNRMDRFLLRLGNDGFYFFPQNYSYI